MVKEQLETAHDIVCKNLKKSGLAQRLLWLKAEKSQLWGWVTGMVSESSKVWRSYICHTLVQYLYYRNWDRSTISSSWIKDHDKLKPYNGHEWQPESFLVKGCLERIQTHQLLKIRTSNLATRFLFEDSVAHNFEVFLSVIWLWPLTIVIHLVFSVFIFNGHSSYKEYLEEDNAA